jgi:multiple sugar transport system substrate-binding protein
MRRSRNIVAACSLVALAALATPAWADRPFADVGKQEPMTLLTPASPWLPAFSKMIALYEAQTGNSIKLDVNPYRNVLDKARNDVRSGGGTYGAMVLDTPWTVEMYEGGFLAPLTSIDPSFAVPPEVLRYDDSGYWNAQKRWRTANGGALMAFTVLGNVQVFYYRADVLKTAGLAPPRTWEEVEASCAKLHKPPAQYDFVVRADRGNGIRYGWMHWMIQYGGAVVKDPQNGDYTVVLNSPQSKAALDQFIKLETTCGGPSPGAMGQTEAVQLLATGKAVQSQLVLATWASLQDPKKSAVVGKLEVEPLPHPAQGKPGAVFGNWLYAVPKGAPPAQQRAALAFARWFLTYDAQYAYAKAGGIPNRSDVLASDLAQDPALRWMPTYLATVKFAQQDLGYLEGPQVEEAMGLRLNQALLGEMSSGKALNLASRELEEIFRKSGRKTGLGLPPLPE